MMTVIVVNSAHAQEYENTSVVKRDGFEFIVASDKFNYSQKEPVKIYYQVQNISDKDLEYYRTSSCSNGFSINVYDSEGNLSRPLSSNVLLVDPDDDIFYKFGLGFYARLLLQIKEDPAQERAIIIVTSDKEAVKEQLEKLGASKISVGQRLSFVAALLKVTEIPKLAENNFILGISDGEAGICTTAEYTESLKPNESISGSYEWGTLIGTGKKTEFPKPVNPGYHTIRVTFNGLHHCLVVGIDKDYSEYVKPELPCPYDKKFPDIKDPVAFEKTLGMTKQEMIDSYISNQTVIIPSDSKTKPHNLQEILPALKQQRIGISPDNVQCRENYTLIFKSPSAVPLCVSQDTAEKLIDRGYAKNNFTELSRLIMSSESINQITTSDEMNKSIPSISLLDQGVEVTQYKNIQTLSYEQKSVCLKTIQEFVYPLTTSEFNSFSGTAQLIKQENDPAKVIFKFNGMTNDMLLQPIRINNNQNHASPQSFSDDRQETEYVYSFSLLYDNVLDQCILDTGNSNLYLNSKSVLQKTLDLANKHPIVRHYSEKYGLQLQFPTDDWLLLKWLDEKNNSLNSHFGYSWYHNDKQIKIVGMVHLVYSSENMHLTVFVDPIHNNVFVETISPRNNTWNGNLDTLSKFS